VHVIFSKLELFERMRISRGLCQAGSYSLTGSLDSFCCEQEGQLSPEICVKHVAHAAPGRHVQWAILTAADNIYITFRGTEDFLDGIIDLSILSNDQAPHGLRVHSGMYASLHQRNHPVVQIIIEEIQKLRRSDPNLRNVVICGHSLGGGYAIISALTMLHSGIAVSKVLTFGAPQVVIPDLSNTWWQRLNEITTLVVNSYDLVPRLPSCMPWIEEVVIPHLAKDMLCSAVICGDSSEGWIPSVKDQRHRESCSQIEVWFAEQ